MGTPSNKNSLSLLKEYHDRCKNKSRISEPAYDIQSQKPGVFACTCKYQDLITEGAGPSKSSARIEAATNMLLKLNCPVPPPAAAMAKVPDQRSAESRAFQAVSETSHHSTHAGSSNTMKLAKDFYDQYSSKEISQFLRYPPSPEDLQMCFGDINFGMKSPDAPKSDTLYRRVDRQMNPITCFEQVMKELKYPFFVEQAEVDPKLLGHAFVVLLKIDLCCMVIGGHGNSLPEAIERACKNGLDTFLLYMN